MTFDIDVGDRTRRVTIEPGATADRFRVTIDRVTVDVDAVQPASGVWSLLVPATGAVHDVAVAPSAGHGALDVTVAGQTVTLVVNGRRRRHDGGGRGTGAERLAAPMPGKVLRVLVKPGDTVAARQPMVVIEAMKMENELSASRPGRVAEVHVTEQSLVEAGQLLLVIEP